ISLAQYRSLESFAMFASDLDAASKAQLTRGAHLTELLKQPQFHPYSPEQEVVSVWTGTHGKLDDLDLKDVLPFEQGLLDYIDHNTDILKTIRETEEFTADTEPWTRVTRPLVGSAAVVWLSAICVPTLPSWSARQRCR
ncbi:hypothetical protein PN650_22650, partial [Parabacteroides distasonis]|nr:hypothetical protein [Parabacteroides distasonis]